MLIFDIIRFNKKSSIEQLKIIQEEEKPEIKEYYEYNYRFYNSLREMDSIENIKQKKHASKLGAVSRFV